VSFTYLTPAGPATALDGSVHPPKVVVSDRALAVISPRLVDCQSSSYTT
jgi:hypothetical protein